MARKVIHIPPPERRITPAEAAARLRVTRRHVYRLAAQGQITVWKSGRSNILDAAEVDALIVRKGAA